MNILWITNITFPEAQDLLNSKNVLKSTGGWMISASEAIINEGSVKLFVASVRRDVKQLIRLEGKDITYYILPSGLRGTHHVNHSLEPYWRRVRDEVKPDVIHIHGTELTHGLAYVEACGSEHVCLSIQGLLSGCWPYYYYGLKHSEIRKSITISSLLKGGVLDNAKAFKRRGEYEKKLILSVNHIIGRTSWDKARTWAINPEAAYHFGGETLRKEFYEDIVWSYEKCIPHTIFLSQAGYPVKGLHMVLRSMPLVLKQYPDARIRVAGRSVGGAKSWLGRMKQSNYDNIISKIIKKYDLYNALFFTGPLDGKGMIQEYLNCNVFICPSTIENSPNSLGEAQILGVPVLASYVGGIPDMMRGDERHLYRFEEVEMLAHKICNLFEARDFQPQLQLMREEALRRHDPTKNACELIELYRNISME